MKEIIMREKHERELFNQRQRLTSNECLWEMLGESEKRENVIRQELYFAQQNLSTYEKIVGKLQHQLETLQNEKLRLLQFKSAKSKEIEAMETKMRDVEILENIDLQKIIEELKSREKKLKHLTD
jgi:predicted TIM-barrel fold metal-dependent hydrolase